MKEQLVRWLKEICRWNRDDWFIQWIDDDPASSGEYLAKVNIYTHTYKYRITAKYHKDGRTYLGCTVSCRMPRAGEKWNRGNDLPDGTFSKKTWERIKNAIIGYELVKFVKTPKEEKEEKNH